MAAAPSDLVFLCSSSSASSDSQTKVSPRACLELPTRKLNSYHFVGKPYRPYRFTVFCARSWSLSFFCGACRFTVFRHLEQFDPSLLSWSSLVLTLAHTGVFFHILYPFILHWMSHSIPTSHVLSICNLDCSMLFTKWRHHIGTTSGKKNLHKGLLFPLRTGLHTRMHPSPFSGRPSNFSFTICQSKPHFCAKSMAWKAKHECHRLICLIRHGYKISIKISGLQAMALKQAQKIAHAFQAIRLSVTFIIAYYGMSCQ